MRAASDDTASMGGDLRAGPGEPVWLLGNSRPAAYKSIGRHGSLPNLSGLDALIVDMTTLTKDATYQIGRWELAHIQKSIRDRLLGGDRTTVVITSAAFSPPLPDVAAGLLFSSLDSSLDPYAYSNYHALPTVHETVQAGKGHRILPDADSQIGRTLTCSRPTGKGHRILPDAGYDFKAYPDAVWHFKLYIESRGQTINLGYRGPRFYLEKADGQRAMGNWAPLGVYAGSDGGGGRHAHRAS